jgi:hypothetical protein
MPDLFITFYGALKGVGHMLESLILYPISTSCLIAGLRD